MPLVGHHHGYGVDVVTGQHLAEIVVALAAFVTGGFRLLGVVTVDFFLGRFAPQVLILRLVAVAGRIHVANRDDLHVVVLYEATQNSDSLISRSDTGHVDPVARRVGTKDRSRDDPWCNRGGRGLL